MSDEGHEYVDNRPMSSFVSPQDHPINGQSLTTRNNLNQQDPNQPFHSNSQENISKGRNKLDSILFSFLFLK